MISCYDAVLKVTFISHLAMELISFRFYFMFLQAFQM